jgi:hypothetical protein
MLLREKALICAITSTFILVGLGVYAVASLDHNVPLGLGETASLRLTINTTRPRIGEYVKLTATGLDSGVYCNFYGNGSLYATRATIDGSAVYLFKIENMDSINWMVSEVKK